MKRHRPGPVAAPSPRRELPTDPGEMAVDKILENLVVAMEGQLGVPRAILARCMICAAAGLMISEIGHDATSKAIHAYADKVSCLAVKGTA